MGPEEIQPWYILTWIHTPGSSRELPIRAHEQFAREFSHDQSG